VAADVVAAAVNIAAAAISERNGMDALWLDPAGVTFININPKGFELVIMLPDDINLSTVCSGFVTLFIVYISCTDWLLAIFLLTDLYLSV
jgi:hypothetical protein